MWPMNLVLFGLLSIPIATAATTQVGGLVFDDRNGNGLLDADEPGIAGVKLSNGRELVLSDAEGRFAIAVEDGQTVFAIKPTGYRFGRREDGLPDFWRHHLPDGSPPLRYGGIEATSLVGADWQIALQADAAFESDFEVLVFGDPQPKSMADVDYYAGDIVEPLRGRHGAQLGLSLGDIVDDDLSLYPAMNAVTTRLGIPWLHVAGNHDLDFDAPQDAQSLHSFRAHYGPDTFAWEEPGLALVGLDNVVYLPGQRPEYIGGLREDQFAFLEAYLATVPREHLLVLAAHIPFFDARPDRETFRRADRERLFALLQDFPRVLLLTSHSHAQRNVLHDASSGWHGEGRLHEYNVGAACGGFWGGVKDAEGIPSALMADGTPNGHARLVLRQDGDYALFWHPARDAKDSQIALHAPRVLRRGAYPAMAVWANVFMAMPDTRVEFRIGDGDWQPMQRRLEPDPRVLRENLLDDAADSLRGFDRTPAATASPNLWRAMLPTDLAAGEHRIEVRADVPWRGWQHAETSYRLVELDSTPASD